MDQLKRLRTEKGLSQAKLAALADVDPSTVNQIERGVREASPATLRKLADALDVSIAELLEGTAPKASRRSPYEPSLLNGLEDERHADWEDAVSRARQLRERGQARVEELLASWRESKDRREDPAERRPYLDEIGELLQEAYDARPTLFEATSWERFVDQWPEVQAADRFYIELWHLVEGAGLSIRTGNAQEERPKAVEERDAA